MELINDKEYLKRFIQSPSVRTLIDTNNYNGLMIAAWSSFDTTKDIEALLDAVDSDYKNFLGFQAQILTFLSTYDMSDYVVETEFVGTNYELDYILFTNTSSVFQHQFKLDFDGNKVYLQQYLFSTDSWLDKGTYDTVNKFKHAFRRFL